MNSASYEHTNMFVRGGTQLDICMQAGDSVLLWTHDSCICSTGWVSPFPKVVMTFRSLYFEHPSVPLFHFVYETTIQLGRYIMLSTYIRFIKQYSTNKLFSVKKLSRNSYLYCICKSTNHFDFKWIDVLAHNYFFIDLCLPKSHYS